MTIQSNGISIRLWQGKSGRWYWHYYENGRRKLASAKDREKARQRAKAHLAELAGVFPAGMSREELSEFRVWRETRRKSVSVQEVFDRHLAFVETSGGSLAYLHGLRLDLRKFAALHGQRKISEVLPAEVEEFLCSFGAGPRRTNNVRATLVSAFQFAQKNEWLPSGEKTAPEKTPRRKLHRKAVEVFRPEEVEHILSVADDPWKPALAIAAFAGIRTAEVGRLYWRNVRLEKLLIEVPASASKTGKRRLVPILPNLEPWLVGQHDPAEMVAPYESHQVFMERFLYNHPEIKWIRNGLRHSFGSYRCAVLKDVPAVAFEMGNSPAMVMAHYHEAQELSEAMRYFSIVPEKSNQNLTSLSA